MAIHKGIPELIIFSLEDKGIGISGLSVTAVISKGGGSFVPTINNVAAVGSGFYKLTLTAAELEAEVIALKIVGSSKSLVIERNIVFYTDINGAWVE